MESEDHQAFAHMRREQERPAYRHPHGLSVYFVITNHGPPAIREGAKEAGTIAYRHRGAEGVHEVFGGLSSTMNVETLKREITARVSEVLARTANNPTMQRALPSNATIPPSNPPQNPPPTVRPPTGRAAPVPPLHVPGKRQP